jgi:hypothetical protein
MTSKLLSIVVLALLVLSVSNGAIKIHGVKATEAVRVIGAPPWQDWVHYHNYTEIVDTLLYLNVMYPNVVDVFPIGESWENRTIYCIRLTNESNTHLKPKLFFVGYHHAREPISAELALYFVVRAATGFGSNETITRMLNYSEIYVVVALNVDGFKALKGNEWQRKNARPTDEDVDGLFDEDPPFDQNGNGYLEHLYYWDGNDYYSIRYEGVDSDFDGQQDWVGGVDLNRNYGYEWNATVDSGSTDPTAEDYRGPDPFSELETKAIRDLALQNDFKYAISFHSGAESIVYPWGYTSMPSPDDQLFREISTDMSALTGAIYEQSGTWYTTSGVWDDWMYANRSAYAFTCEIYGNDSAWQEAPGSDINTWWEWGIFQAFNPDASHIESVVNRWLPVFTYLADRAINEAYDIAVTNVVAQETTVGQGSVTKVNVTVVNQGAFNETLNVTLKANSTIVQNQTVTLSQASTVTLVFDWNTAAFATGNYRLSGYAEPLPGEVNLVDNTYTDDMVRVVHVPVVSVVSPENRTYVSCSVVLNFTVDEPVSWMGYSLDGLGNVTVTGNTTLTSLTEGSHHVTVFANNTAGVIGVSNTIRFAVDTVAPNITDVHQLPAQGNVMTGDEVNVNATVSDSGSGVKRVTLNFIYTNSSGAWFRAVNMTNVQGSIWRATIIKLPYGTNVTYVIIAEDNAGNMRTTEELGFTYEYQVIPELEPSVMLVLLVTATLLVLGADRRKHRMNRIPFSS